MSGSVAVFAHFDTGGVVSSYVHRYLAELAGAVDSVVVVSSADLGPAERSALADHGQLIMRENVGYDFSSWRAGLDSLGDLSRYDRIVLGNDSVIGPVVSLREVLSRPPAADFWTMTASVEIAPHLQSWFVVYEGALLRTGLVGKFWDGVRPESHRYEVVRRYEIGQSRLFADAGVRLAPWFAPTPRERVLAEIRYQRWLSGQPAARHDREDEVSRYRRRSGAGPLARLDWRDRLGRWNPSYACWDAVLTGRLPFVKTELLRDDPMGIDSDVVLTRLEEAYPVAFSGVRDHLDRTRADLKRLRRLTA